MVFDKYEDVRLHLVETLSLSKELLTKISNLFISSSEELFSKIQEGIKTENMTLLRESAHTLKGSSANIGGKRVQEIAYDLQIAAEKGETALCGELSEKLLNAIKNLQKILEKIASE